MRSEEDVYEARWCPVRPAGYMLVGGGVCERDRWKSVSAKKYEHLRELGYRVRKNGRRTTKR